MKAFIIFDNGGKTIDRFTILNKETGEIYGAGEDPFSTEGFGRFFGNCAYQHFTLYGIGWREVQPAKRIIKSEVDKIIINAKLNPSWLGKQITFNQLPENVQKYIAQLNTTVSN